MKQKFLVPTRRRWNAFFLVPTCRRWNTLILITFTMFFLTACETTQTTRTPSENVQQPAGTLVPPDSPPVTKMPQLALVIGNRDYEYQRLANTVNDATDMAEQLKQMGFDVTLKTNLNQVAMETVISQFTVRLAKTPGVGLFYFSGHGTQVDGHNYLLPIDNQKIVDRHSLKAYAVNVGNSILARMDAAKNHLNVIILDACRDDPFPSIYRNAMVKGLARMQSTTGTIIAFATAPGDVASDVSIDEDNGLYTKYLLTGLQQAYQKHQRIDDMLMQVRNSVIQESRGAQEPWYNASLSAPYCFGGCSTVATPTVKPSVSTSNTSPTVTQPQPVQSSPPSLELPPLPDLPEIPQTNLLSSISHFRDRLKDGSLGPEMVVIPAGRFRMGDIQGGGNDDEKPVHWVNIEQFAMGKYEVTFAEYDKFAEATSREKPDDEGWGRGNRPVINVSWNDATAYIKWLSQQTGKQYRLPTEAEWEYAARAGTETKYWWGNEIGSNKANCYGDKCGDNFRYTAPVGSFKSNPFGLYDTVGNVWEWTCSEYENKYGGKEQKCPLSNNNANNRVLRGGSWSYFPDLVRAAFRYRYYPDSRNFDCGFRVVARTHLTY